jgi:hypothetical protein
MSLDPITAALDIGGKIIDKIFPDPAQRDAAKLQLIKAQQDGQLAEVNAQLSAILAEAQSSDPWTSRARPSFLYVMYLLILAAIPMGIVSAISPEMAINIGKGFGAWLMAVPDSVWGLFGVGYLGYTGARSWDKAKGTAS